MMIAGNDTIPGGGAPFCVLCFFLGRLLIPRLSNGDDFTEARSLPW